MLGHQHTSCENLPLRFLMYVAELLNRHIAPFRKKLYQPTLLPIPAPAFFVFYDGNAPEQEQRTLRLSDAFGGEGALELCVRLYNISGSMNANLKERCPFLGDYSRFSDRLKKNRRNGMEPDAAIRETLEYCRQNGIMDDYLPYKSKEVFRMLNYAWNEDEAREALIEYGTEQGIRQGIRQGIEQGADSTMLDCLKRAMRKLHLSAEEAMDMFEVPAGNRARYAKML